MRDDDRESCVSTGEAIPEGQFSNRGDGGKLIVVRVISDAEMAGYKRMTMPYERGARRRDPQDRHIHLPHCNLQACTWGTATSIYEFENISMIHGSPRHKEMGRQIFCS